MPSTTYTDHSSLMHDLQTLLTTPSLCDATIRVGETTLALPTPLVRARSPYFSSLLSLRWHTSALSKPNTTAPVFQDLLEYLVTGAVTLSLSLSAIPHNIALAALAHEVACDELERTVVRHIRDSLSVLNLRAYIDAFTLHHVQPSPMLEQVFVDFVAANCVALPALLDRVSWRVASSLWRLLVNAHATCPLPPVHIGTVSRSFANMRVIESGRIIHVKELLQREPQSDQKAMLNLLAAAPPLTFAREIEPTQLFSQDETLAKYRDDALAAQKEVVKRPRVRVLCESEHPHAYGAILDDTVRRVSIPSEGLCDCLLRFDRRSSLGDGAELAFYTRDPGGGGDPYTFLVGSRLPDELVLPGGEFWYAFASAERRAGLGVRWGWRFFVEAIEPQIGAVD